MAAVPQFVSRLDNVVVFHTPKNEDFEEILETELKQVQKHFLSSTPVRFFFRLTIAARQFSFQEGTRRRFGARQLQRAMECYLVCPIERLLATAQIKTGDILIIDRHPSKKALVFFKDKDREMRQRFAPYVPQTSNHFGNTPTAA
jgi:ATP-dependent Clp protease ATP-binding subunit ClpC